VGVRKLIVSLCYLRVKPVLRSRRVSQFHARCRRPTSTGYAHPLCAQRPPRPYQFTSAVNQQRQPVPATLASPL